jgi:hypothetical protein
MEVIDHVPLIKPLPVVSTRMTPYARQLPPFLVCLGLERSDRLREKLPIVTGGYLLQGMAVEAEHDSHGNVSYLGCSRHQTDRYEERTNG